jgi:hypothetical protein
VYGASKNEEFYADFKFVEMGSKIILEKVIGKNYASF